MQAFMIKYKNREEILFQYRHFDKKSPFPLEMKENTAQKRLWGGMEAAVHLAEEESGVQDGKDTAL